MTDSALEHRVREFLQERAAASGVPASGNGKSALTLAHELRSGESYLARDPLRRVTHVVRVILQRGSLVLLETRRQAVDGVWTELPRSLLPSEKILPGETYTEAAQRCLWEELQITPGTITVREYTHTVSRELRSSRSYPSLLTEYVTHTVEAEAANWVGYGTDALVTSEVTRGPVVRHAWEWRVPNSERYLLDLSAGTVAVAAGEVRGFPTKPMVEVAGRVFWSPAEYYVPILSPTMARQLHRHLKRAPAFEALVRDAAPELLGALRLDVAWYLLAPPRAAPFRSARAGFRVVQMASLEGLPEFLCRIFPRSAYASLPQPTHLVLFSEDGSCPRFMVPETTAEFRKAVVRATSPEEWRYITGVEAFESATGSAAV